MKKINIRIKDIDKMEFELLENAQAGDYISLNGLTEKNSQIISEHISKAVSQISDDVKNKIYQEAIADNSKSILESKEYNDLKLENQKTIQALKDEFYKTLIPNEIAKSRKEWEVEIQNQLKAKELEVKNDLSEKIAKVQSSFQLLQKDKQTLETTIKEKEEKIKELNQNLKEAKKDFELQTSQKLKTKELEVRQTYTEKFKNQETQIEVLKNTKTSLDKTIQDKTKEIEALKNQLNGLMIKRSSLSHIQAAGEDYETYIHSLLQQNFNMDNDIRFYKATQVINGMKPDIIIEFFDKKSDDPILIGKLVVEIKAKVSEKGSKKNEEFYEKLFKDTKNNKADYGILITELNPDEDIFIEQVQGYKNIFVVRDRSFLTLVRMLRMMFDNKARLSVDLKDFKDKEIIKQEFKNFFEKEIARNFEIIKEKFSSIVICTQDIIKAAKKIEDRMEEIEKTSIKKITTAFETKFSKQDFLEKLDSFNKRRLENVKEINPIEEDVLTLNEE
ncbi:DUF2130 domain-containing protein [Mycoplasmopsis bovirhinis]|uniref:Uncharacterized protein conserved in bacteria n=1 Tax=Mycoplasmopsis bovirhinis TaxID=29553 RepID=A0A449ACU6_9BACT|nr:DUF2130 domain-containing protein [Mycoplasmopsis bovirhinis]VEU62871.1 Uncharacterized protein conserved in bacteria [Mycoplasmopsis bovirhinis]